MWDGKIVATRNLVAPKSDVEKIAQAPTAIDLFSGCGGMSVGLIESGFEIILALDVDEVANAEYAANIGIVPTQADLFELTPEQILSLANIRSGELDLLVGCPPCQGFTNLRKRGKPYHTSRLVPVMAELASAILPAFVLFENVSGILRYGQGQFGEYLDILANAGYSTVFGVLQAANFGVPQFRKRLIAISTRLELPSQGLWLPDPTHAKPELASDLDLQSWRTVRDAIADLPSLGNGEVCLTDPTHRVSYHGDSVFGIIRNVPRNGGSRKDLPKHLWLRCHRNITGGAENVYGRMAWDCPSNTVSSRSNVPACGRFIHPEQHRAISIREALRLQTFPDSFQFNTGISHAAKLTGNAMPVLLARKIGEHIYKMLQTRSETKVTA